MCCFRCFEERGLLGVCLGNLPIKDDEKQDKKEEKHETHSL